MDTLQEQASTQQQLHEVSKATMRLHAWLCILASSTISITFIACSVGAIFWH
ncbi:hypothetical protein [Noviherbaspirillum malthae]|uniref:hypothetical protein n=1 Tax=Noviherbaspirillum malthae TaxID=1260987 RepID=UPI00188FAB87|nr:hypothetical protein [Noviherbaspirillum malthae]